jgi:hypothetical protein
MSVGTTFGTVTTVPDLAIGFTEHPSSSPVNIARSMALGYTS